jgi:LDH2 family malate/lactate/ureidoglycolate dehydrogenase
VSSTLNRKYGMEAWLVQQAMDADMMSLTLYHTNSSPAMAPVGSGTPKTVGVSPMACGAPGAGADSNLILDMAPSIAARGKIYTAQRRGEEDPPRLGHPHSRPPAAALKGFMLRMGGPKGFGLVITMDIFAGVLSGSVFAGHVSGPSGPSGPGKTILDLLIQTGSLSVEQSEAASRILVNSWWVSNRVCLWIWLDLRGE